MEEELSLSREEVWEERSHDKILHPHGKGGLLKQSPGERNWIHMVLTLSVLGRIG